MPVKTFPLGFPWDTPDPFLFCVHHLDRFPEGNENMGPKASLTGRSLGNDFTLRDGWRMYHGRTVPGFPAHPHCGFETVTLVTQGFCDHSDSLGAAARFGQGDAQWITTGKGLQHSEMFPLRNPDAPNTLELFQIWLNLPARSKHVAPYFQMLWKESLPDLRQEGCRVRLVAGHFSGQNAPSPPPDSWASDPDNHVTIGLIDLEPSGSITLPAIPEGVNRRVYLFEGGQATVRDTALSAGHGADPGREETTITAGDTPCRLLWLQGRAISEPVAKYGPFVMNRPEEIEAALADFRRTEFGGWPWDRPDPVHAREKGRFALFPDGKEVVKD